jgi:hypothetical protein
MLVNQSAAAYTSERRANLIFYTAIFFGPRYQSLALTSLIPRTCLGIEALSQSSALNTGARPHPCDFQEVSQGTLLTFVYIAVRGT